MRALIVDDNIINLKVGSALLKYLGYEVETAKDGDEGLSKWMAKPFDFVLTDYQMPMMDGIELILRIRLFEAAEQRSRCQIVVNSSIDPDEVEEFILDAGADTYLRKPLRLEDLKSALRSYRTPLTIV